MESQNKNPLIKIQDLSVIYNKGKSNEVRALENINLEIYPQEYVIIFGPSGCGKSTLLYTISGLQQSTSGTIQVGNKMLNELKEKAMAEFHRYKIGMVFQAFYLVESLNILNNVCLPKIFDGEKEESRENLAMSLLERFGMKEYAERFPSELSGGQKQRVSVARSLVNNPEIILADEPVGNLDSKSAYNVMKILEDLNSADKKTVILVTHDPAHLEYGDRVVYMRDGKITKIESVSRREFPDLESYIFKKDGSIREDLEKRGLVKEEVIPPELKMLIRSFSGLSASQAGALLVPFKANQLFSHIFFSMTEEQINAAKKKVEELLFGRLDLERFKCDLDNNAGISWDKRLVESFSRRIENILDEISKIDFSHPEISAVNLAGYLIKAFGLNFTEEKKQKLARIIFDRLKNKIGLNELEKILDLPEKEGGLGFDKRTAKKTARELEVILLLRY